MKCTLPTLQLSAHLPRILTGLCLAAVLVACLLTGGVALYLLIVVASLAALLEFFCLFWPGRTRLFWKILGLACGYGIMHAVMPAQTAKTVTEATGLFFRPQVATVLFFAFAAAAASFLMDYGRGNDAASLDKHAILPLGLLYVSCSMALALGLSVREQFLVVVAAVSSDTFAYYAGCMWGKHKIWPRVSPKKSWEGSIGGFFGCMLLTALLGGAFFGFGKPGGPVSLPHVLAWLGMGMFLNVAAQLGDFFESALKRSRNVKDSSMLLPGHGGVLDRIDSMLFALPAYCFAKMALDSCLPSYLVP